MRLIIKILAIFIFMIITASCLDINKSKERMHRDIMKDFNVLGDYSIIHGLDADSYLNNQYNFFVLCDNNSGKIIIFKYWFSTIGSESRNLSEIPLNIASCKTKSAK